MPGMEWAWLAPAFGLAAFAVLALFRSWLPRRGAYLAIVAIAAAFVLFWFILRDHLKVGGAGTFEVTWLELGGLRLTWGTLVDSLAVLMLGIVTAVALLIQVYSLRYMGEEGRPRFLWYFAVHSLFAAAMLGLVLADNFLFLYITWELVGLCSYLLIGFWYERRSAAEAAKKAFVVTRLGDVGLLVGILLLYSQVGTFDMSTIFHVVGQSGAGAGPLSSGTITVVAILIFLGAAGKSAQFPLHVWLPDAMEGPTPVSALIHAATMVAAGVYLVARSLPIFVASETAMLVVATVGLVTALMAAGMALVMTDLKRILAYSTISHLGFMMLALGAGALTAGMFHLLTHAFAKALLFLGAGALMHGGLTDIRQMGGLRTRMPLTFVTFGVGALALGGIPPFSGFFSKDEVLTAVLEGLNPAFFILTMLFVFLSALYMGRALFALFFGPVKDDGRHAHEAPWLMVVPMLLLAVPALGVGFVAPALGGYLFFGEPEGFSMNAAVVVASVIMAVAGFYLAWILHLGILSPQRLRERFATAHRVLVNKFYMDDAYQWGVDRIALAFSNILAAFDRIVVNDAGVNGTGSSVVRSGLRLRYHETGRMYNYALAMALGVVVLALVWWLAIGL